MVPHKCQIAFQMTSSQCLQIHTPVCQSLDTKKREKKDEKEFTTSVLEKVEILSEQDFGKMWAVHYLHVRSTYIEEIPNCNIN